MHVGGSQRLQGARGLQEAPNHKKRCPSHLECKSSIKMLILHSTVFEGQITKYCKLLSKIIDGSSGRSVKQIKAPYTRLLEPLRINLFGE